MSQKEAEDGHYRLVTAKELLQQVRGTQSFSRAVPLLENLAAAFPDLTLTVLRYKYGQDIVDDGELVAPHGESDWCAGPCKQLVGRGIPLCLVLSNPVEVFLWRKADRERSIAARGGPTVPLRILKEGEFFGVFETLARRIGASADSPWCVQSGARSLDIIFPFANVNLKRALGCGEYLGSLESDPWQAVKSVAQDLDTDWDVEVAVFPPKLHAMGEKLDGRRKHMWLQFWNHLYRIGWEQGWPLLRLWGIDMRDPVSGRSVVSHAISDAQALALVKHILALERGDFPAMGSVLTLARPAGPFFEVLEALMRPSWRRWMNRQEGAVPVLMQPVHLLERGDTGYISLRSPRLFVEDLDDYPALMQKLNGALRHLHERPRITLLRSRAPHSECPDNLEKNPYPPWSWVNERLAKLQDDFFPTDLAHLQGYPRLQAACQARRVYLGAQTWFVAAIRVERSA